MKSLYAALFALGAISLAACDGGDGPVEEVGEDIDNVVDPQVGDGDDAGEALEDTADDIGDAAEDAGDEVEDAVDDPA